MLSGIYQYSFQIECDFMSVPLMWLISHSASLYLFDLGENETTNCWYSVLFYGFCLEFSRWRGFRKKSGIFEKFVQSLYNEDSEQLLNTKKIACGALLMKNWGFFENQSKTFQTFQICKRTLVDYKGGNSYIFRYLLNDFWKSTN